MRWRLLILYALTFTGCALAAAPNTSLNVSASARVSGNSAPLIVATAPTDGSTVTTATPQLQVVFSTDMNTSLVDASKVYVPPGLFITALVWLDSRTLSIQYSGAMNALGAKRIDLADKYFRAADGQAIPINSGYAFNYGDIPPTFTIQPSYSPAAPQTTDMITFTCQAASPVNATLTYTWNFGDGTFGSGATVQHMYANADSYLVTITVTDGFGGQLLVPMLVKVSQGAAALPPTTVPWTVTRATVNLNFKTTGRDHIAIQGTVSLAAGYSPLKQTAQVTVGAVSATFTLDKNGRGKSGPNRFVLIRKLKKKQFAGGPVKINFTLRGAFASALASSGITNAVTPKAGTMVALPVTLTLSGQQYVDQPSVLWKVSKSQATGVGRFVKKLR